MKTLPTSSALCAKKISLARIGVFVILAALICVPLFSKSSASSAKDNRYSTSAHGSRQMVNPSAGSLETAKRASSLFMPASLLRMVPEGSETITLFAADCSTAKSSFNLGEVVCAKTDGVDLTVPNNYYLNWFGPNGEVNGGTITQNPQTFYFTLPTNANDAGLWKVNIGRVSPAETSIIGNPPNFNVGTDPVISLYAGDCTTPKSVFNLQDTNKTVCAKVTGGSANQYILWSNANFELVQSTPLGSGQATFTLGPSSSLGDWRVILYERLGGSVYAVSSFTVIDAANPEADLSIVKGPLQTSVSSGSQAVFSVQVTNLGPSDATAVQISDDVPANTTFSSFALISGPNDTNCILPTAGAGGGSATTCTIPTLARGETALFVATYDVLSGVTPGTLISNTASVSSAVDDPRPLNNQSVSEVAVESGGAGSCSLDCPSNIVVTANTTSGGEPGAFVSFGGGEPTGDCGEVTNSPASGSFFTVGTHSVISTAQFGGSCSFTVTVLDTTPPSITCPAGVTVNLDAGETEATLTLAQIGTPTINASGGGTVTSERSDDDKDPNTPPKPLTDPYPIGSTGINWIVTDAGGRKASCTQTITVNANCASDTAAPTITAPADITVGTGPDNTSCSVSLDDELGQAVAHDDCSVTVTVSGIPPGNNFPRGTTVLTYTAKDPSGHTATDTQNVTVIDNTAPIIAAPANATYTCLSDVPAASPAQAKGPVLGADGQFLRDTSGNLILSGPPFDNCGAPIVTVSETSTGTGTLANPKVITRTFTATDASLNTSSATQTIIVTDSTPPTISCPSNITVYLPLNSPATTMPVSFTVGASDNCSGVSVSTTKASGSNFDVGTTTVTATATDAVGNTASCSFTVTVLYNFTGFFAPVENLPTFNEMKAGQAVPVKFSLSGNKGLNIFAVDSPNSVQISCTSGDPVAAVEETVTAGSSSLSYDASSDRYNYVWKTDSAWKNTCRQLNVVLNDGSTHSAKFKFK